MFSFVYVSHKKTNTVNYAKVLQIKIEVENCLEL